MDIPDDGGGVVVAVRAQRPAQDGVDVFVALAAGQAPSVPAQVSLAAGAAPGSPAAGSGAAGVHRAEGGGGEGGEHARVGADRLGDVLATDQSGTDELVGVTAVGLGAGRADRSAAVPARGAEPTRRRCSLVLGRDAARP